MMGLTKRIVRGIARHFGQELVNTKTFGLDLSRDIATLLSGREKMVIFDIGANVGEAVIEFSALFGDAKIYAFEPDPSTYSKLTERVALHKDRIRTYNLGLGSANESRPLTISQSSGGNSFLEVSPSIDDFAKGGWTEPIGKVPAQITTLNAFCGENSVDAIDLIKIDTQGYEMEVLKGANEVIIPGRTRLISIEVLFVELYSNQCYFQEVYDELSGRGYRLVGLYNKFLKTEPPHFLLWCDALFASEAD